MGTHSSKGSTHFTEEPTNHNASTKFYLMLITNSLYERDSHKEVLFFNFKGNVLHLPYVI